MSEKNQIQEIMDALQKQVSDLQEEVLEYRARMDEIRFLIVYEKENGEVKTYEVSQLDLANSFGNQKEDRDNVGFRAYCHVREEFRSFRHDRIRAITRF